MYTRHTVCHAMHREACTVFSYLTLLPPGQTGLLPCMHQRWTTCGPRTISGKLKRSTRGSHDNFEGSTWPNQGWQAACVCDGLSPLLCNLLSD